MTDWRDTLKAFAESNPQLPEGNDITIETEAVSAPQPRLDISLERKGRGGKTATLITGWTCPDDELKAIASKLKSTLACGGSARGGDILIQGDRRIDVKARLESLGYKARII